MYCGGRKTDSAHAHAGDIHDLYYPAFAIVAKAKGDQPGSVPVVQVGDLEWHPDRPPTAAPWPIHWCEGNHDHLPSLDIWVMSEDRRR